MSTRNQKRLVRPVDKPEECAAPSGPTTLGMISLEGLEISYTFRHPRPDTQKGREPDPLPLSARPVPLARITSSHPYLLCGQQPCGPDLG